MRTMLSTCSSASSSLLQTDLSIQSLRYSASSTALYSELGGRFASVCFTDSCLQLPPKKRPSPLHSISGWESRMRMSHVVPDFCWPTTKKTVVAPTTGRTSSPRARASSLLSAAISASLMAIRLRACRLTLDRRELAAVSRDDFAHRSVSTALLLPGVIVVRSPQSRAQLHAPNSPRAPQRLSSGLRNGAGNGPCGWYAPREAPQSIRVRPTVSLTAPPGLWKRTIEFYQPA